MGLTPEFSITVLGNCGTYAGADGSCTGLLVRAAGRSILLDCGPGTVANLQRHLPLRSIDAVVITHCHPDHWLDLPVLRNAWRYVLGVESVPVYGTRETLEMCDVLLGGELLPTFDWSTVTSGDRVEIAGTHWRFSATDHPVETLACRVDVDGKSFAFSADTGPGWGFEELGPDIDLALCESTYLAWREPEGAPHLSARQAGETARRAGVGRLVLTHLLPGEDPTDHEREAEAAFGGPVSVSAVHDQLGL